MKFTFYGHSSFMVETMGKKLLFDPFITPNELAKDININKLNPDYIILSHGHGDHIADVEAIYFNSNATLISNFEVVNWFEAKGVENGHPMNHGGSWSFDFGKLKMVNAIHSSSMPDGSNGGNPAGIVITNKEGCFYYSGDTALTKDMELIGEEFNLDFSIMPVGDNFTMGVTDAIKAAKMVKCNTLIGVHFDTFPYIIIEHEESIEQAEAAGVKLILPEIGEQITF
ncbi:metal-dependent hydrolase [Roseivirga echinicomitans]|uniref:Hydrolase n=1 Tax=Roseivirga echinicomitans TaxID=296218 RepID=A0A150X3B4_9BACT|nr:metal-dependent hydrolase [Roseivirga echinicomitans]KYG73225.1 hydrolase [Roseivirga echinicomitans]